MRIPASVKIVIILVVSAVFFAPAVECKERVYIKVGELRSVFTDSPRRISISDPIIADVTSVTKEEILIIGKSPGNTIINIWDKWGKQRIDVDVYLENLSSLKKRIERLFKSAGIIDANLEINTDEDKIIVSGDVKKGQEERFELLTDPFKDKLINLVEFTELRQSILIDVNILELDISESDKLGFNWQDFFSVTESGTSGVAVSPTTGDFAEMFKIGNWTRTALSTRLNLLVSNGKGKILSRPKLVCLSGEEAEFLVGGEVPIVTTVVSDEGTSVNVEYKEYGVSLKVQPTIESGDGIRTSLTTEVSELDWTNAVTASGIRIPALATRSTSTEIFINEGQTIFLAGLLKNKDSSTIDRVPGLGDIPVLGHLFRSREFTNDQTELVLTLTPTIIGGGSSSRFVSVDKKEEAVSKEKEEEEILEKKEDSKDVPPELSEEISESSDEGEYTSFEDLKEPVIDYAQLVQEIIQKQFFYPKEAKDKDLSGTVVLSLHIFSDGTISDVSLSHSSGFESLDTSAVSLVRNIAGFEPFPDALPLEDLWIDIPIEYHLD